MTMTFSVRRLAAVDLHGLHGNPVRRRLVAVEFPLTVAVTGALGGYLLASGGVSGWIGGLWLLGVAANYLPLTMHAVLLSRPGRLAAELRDVEDLAAEARRYSIAQVRLLIPGLVAVLSWRQRGRLSR